MIPKAVTFADGTWTRWQHGSVIVFVDAAAADREALLAAALAPLSPGPGDAARVLEAIVGTMPLRRLPAFTMAVRTGRTVRIVARGPLRITVRGRDGEAHDVSAGRALGWIETSSIGPAALAVVRGGVVAGQVVGLGVLTGVDEALPVSPEAPAAPAGPPPTGATDLPGPAMRDAMARRRLAVDELLEAGAEVRSKLASERPARPEAPPASRRELRGRENARRPHVTVPLPNRGESEDAGAVGAETAARASDVETAERESAARVAVGDADAHDIASGPHPAPAGENRPGAEPADAVETTEASGSGNADASGNATTDENAAETTEASGSENTDASGNATADENAVAAVDPVDAHAADADDARGAVHGAEVPPWPETMPESDDATDATDTEDAKPVHNSADPTDAEDAEDAPASPSDADGETSTVGSSGGAPATDEHVIIDDDAWGDAASKFVLAEPGSADEQQLLSLVDAIRHDDGPSDVARRASEDDVLYSLLYEDARVDDTIVLDRSGLEPSEANGTEPVADDDVDGATFVMPVSLAAVRASRREHGAHLSDDTVVGGHIHELRRREWQASSRDPRSPGSDDADTLMGGFVQRLRAEHAQPPAAAGAPAHSPLVDPWPGEFAAATQMARGGAAPIVPPPATPQRGATGEAVRLQPTEPTETVAAPVQTVAAPSDTGAVEPTRERFVLEFQTGGQVDAQGAAVVGRAPNLGPSRPGDPMPQYVRIVGSSDISRNHVRIEVTGGVVVVSDLHSRNGTDIVMPGRPPQRLRAGEPTAVMPGTVVDLGSGIAFTVRR